MPSVGGDRVELGRRERRLQRLVGEPEGRSRVGAAAAEPGRDRDPLRDRRTPAGLDAGGGGERGEGVADDRVAGEAGDRERRTGLDRDSVGEIDPLQEGRDLVLAVRAGRADDEREIDLRRRRRSHSASVSAANSAGASASARASGGRPIEASAAAATSREQSPASASEFGSVLRRWANAASTTCLIRAKSSGSGKRRKATSAESTFGGGRKTVRETGWKPVLSDASWISTETPPYAFVDGVGEKAVGDLPLHHHRPELDAGQSCEALGDDRGGDVVGQVRDQLGGSWIERREVELKRVAPVQLDVRPLGERREVRCERSVELDGVDVVGTIGEAVREDAEAGSDLQHDVVAAELGEAIDHAEDVLVGEEVLAELLLRADAHGRRKAAVAFASMRATSSDGSSPRARASAATVWTTCAGSFGRPRTGCGAR